MLDQEDMAQFGGADLYYPTSSAREVRAELRLGDIGPEAGIGFPAWVAAITPRLQDVMTLRSDWNSYGARPIEFSNLQAAVDLLKWIMRPNTPSPIIMPTSDGSLQLEWHERGLDLEIRVRGRGRYYANVEDSRTLDGNWEGMITADLTQLKNVVEDLTGRSD